MKKIAFSILLLCSGISFSQQNDFTYPQDKNKKNELKISPSSLVILESIDISFERLVTEDSSYGISIFLNTNTEDNNVNFERDFSVTPFYRWFFNERTFARGFFVEGFGMLNTTRDEFFDRSFDSFGNLTGSYIDGETKVRFALGISVGGKFVLKSGFTAEVFLGVGRNILGESTSNNYDSDNGIVGRGGISLGYRF